MGSLPEPDDELDEDEEASNPCGFCIVGIGEGEETTASEDVGGAVVGRLVGSAEGRGVVGAAVGNNEGRPEGRGEGLALGKRVGGRVVGAEEVGAIDPPNNPPTPL